MTTYTEQEMLNLYRNSLGLSRVLTLPAENERRPLDRELLNVVRSRYLHLLTEASVELLPVEDLAPESDMRHDSERGCLVITLPERCVRPVSLHLKGWPQGVYTFRAAGCALHRRQRFPLLRATVGSPLVFRSADTLLVYGLPADTDGSISYSLRAVAPPADNSFRLDASLLPDLIH